MDDQEATALLRKKWDDEQAFRESGLFYHVDNYVGFTTAQNRVFDTRGNGVYSAPWWAKREQARIAYGVYAQSLALQKLHSSFLNQYFVHISQDDPTMIAYTPAFESGAVDKQVKTTLGRFLRKHAFYLSDNQIQAIDASHRAEVLVEIRYATTRKEIEVVYTNMAGDSGCMRYSGSKWNLPDGLHPSHVYEAPGMAVAYTQDDVGTIKSRCLVWTNPDDANDKRYVRLYGDSRVLELKLKQAGYVLSPLNGARLARIPRYAEDDDNYDPDAYLMPYLDGPAGAQSDYRGRYVQLDADPRYIRIIGSDRAAKLTAIESHSAALAGNHDSARVILTEAPNTVGTCPLSGVKYDLLENSVSLSTVMLADGTITKVLSDALDSVEYTCVYTQVKGSRQVVLVAQDEGTALAKPKTFDYGGLPYIESDYNRHALGYATLSVKYYGDEAAWSTDYVTTDDGEVIKVLDAVTLLDDTGTRTVFAGELQKYRAEGWVNTAAFTVKRRALIRPDGVNTRKTAGGTYISTVHHNDRYCELFDGTWAETRKTESLYLFGTYVRYLRDGAGPDQTDPAFLLSAVDKSALKMSVLSLRSKALAARTARDAQNQLNAIGEMLRSAQVRYGGGIPRYTGVNGSPTWEPMQANALWSDVRANVATCRALADGERVWSQTTGNSLLNFRVFDALHAAFGDVRDEVAEHVRALRLQEDEALLAKLEAAKAEEAAARAAAQAEEDKKASLQSEIDRLLEDLDAA